IGELQAGARPPAALAAAAETAPLHAAVFAAAARAAAEGDDAAEVLVGEAATRSIGLAWRLGETLGLEIAGVLSRVEHDLAAAAIVSGALPWALVGCAVLVVPAARWPHLRVGSRGGRAPARNAAIELALVLDLAAAGLRSGLPLADALALAAPAGTPAIAELL